MFIYRKLEDNDFADICRMQRAYKGSIHESLPKPEAFDLLKQAIKNGSIEFYGAYDRDKIIGICSLCRTFSTFQYESIGVVEDFYILTDYRGRGISKELMDYLYRDSGLSVLSVTCSEETLPLFRTLGFRYEVGLSYLRID